VNLIYSKKSLSQWFKWTIKSLTIPGTLDRRSMKNALKDYRNTLKSNNKNLWTLHTHLEHIREEMKSNYNSYDYGNGYYYQSMQMVNISGHRNTEDRVEQLALRNRVAGKTVLDIGANAGFLLLSLAPYIKKGIGIEINDYLVSTGLVVKNYLDVTNIDFISGAFEDYSSSHGSFDIILSLANHCTFDGNTKQNIDSYFKKISYLLVDEGQIVFESHPPEIEPKEVLDKTINILKKYFLIEEEPYVNMDGFLDRNRHYIIARKKALCE
jgi:SAM-dependent methyltransferase